jgi:predicted nucleotidyltransferase
MNKIRDDFPENIKDFFVNLQNYLDTDLYFYGSVNRSDYVHGKSDIDVAIFTDNEYSTITKLQHFLHVKRSAFDKVVWKLEGNMIYGYKIKCDKYTNSKCEIAIYNNDFKEYLLNDIKKYNTIPFHVSICLFILKMLYYTFPILSVKTYDTYKRLLFNKIMVNKQDTVFFVLKENKV